MTETRRIAGGPPVPSLAMVSADQVTIIGRDSRVTQDLESGSRLEPGTT